MKLLLDADYSLGHHNQKRARWLLCLLLVFFAVNNLSAGKRLDKPVTKTTTVPVNHYNKFTNHQGSVLPGISDIATYQYLRLQLAKGLINTDDIMIRFQRGANPDFDINVDARYFQGNGQVNLCSFSSDGVPLAINLQPYPKTSEPIGLKVFVKTDGSYQLNLTQIVNIPRLFDVWLMDAYQKDSIDMRKFPNYRFNVLKSDTNSFGSKRFKLVIRQNPVYAFQLLNFTAIKIVDSTGVRLSWDTKNEADYTRFTIERSTDNGATFRALDTLLSGGLGSYSIKDNIPASGSNIYRLKLQDFNNTITYSAQIMVSFSTVKDQQAKTSINLFPNPVISEVNLVITPKLSAPDIFDIRIFNMTGLLVKQASSAQTSWQGNVESLKPGTYIIKVSNQKDNSPIGNTKFVKL